MTRASLFVAAFAVLLAFAPPTPAQSIVVGTTTDGKIAFQPVDDFQIDQSRKIRLLPDQPGEVDPSAVKKLPKIDLSQAALVRSDGSGRLVNLNGPNAPRDIVLPENYTLRSPAPVKDIPGPLTLSLKKIKQSDPLRPEQFVVVLFGNTPDESVREFVDKDWAFLNLDEQLAAMRGFAAAFPSSPATRVFRDSLERRISDGLETLEAGGAYKNFLATRRFSELGRELFPGDAPLRALNDRVSARVQFLTERPKLLQSLAVLGDWDTLLDKYRDFEPYAASFPEIQSLHQEALTESARDHARRARAFEQRGDYTQASREASLALSRDPSNPGIRKLAADEKLLVSQGVAMNNASRLRVLPKGLPADMRFSTALAAADAAIAAKDFPAAETSIEEANHENPGAPQVILARAKLQVAQGHDPAALPLLDQYDSMAINSTDREKGYELRRKIVSDLDEAIQNRRRQIAALVKAGKYSQLNDALRAALQLDPGDPEFLYQGGVTAAVLRDPSRATTLLNNFLTHSNAIGVDPKQVDKARLILNILKDQPRGASGAVYDPQTVAFQIPIASVSGNKVHMTFNWTGGRLNSIRTTFDDDKGAEAYRALVVAGAADSGALSAATIGNAGNFFFDYFPNGVLRQVLPGQPAPGSAKPYNVHVVRDDQGNVRLMDDNGQPEIVMPGHPYVDAAVLAAVEDAPVTSLVAGNSFFNPFLWDGVHVFTVQYDSDGRAESAREWNANNTVRFSWDGSRLTAVRAYHKDSATPYYQRTLTYQGSVITGENYTLEGRSGTIKYVYANGTGLQQVKIDADGKEWIARPR